MDFSSFYTQDVVSTRYVQILIQITFLYVSFSGKLDNVFKHEEPVYGLSIDPQNDSIFATASENGVVLLFDQRTDPADPLVVASLSSSFLAVEFHPTMSHLMVTANSKRGAALYDTRKPKQ